ncbi:MAG: ROK family protein [Candidatus Omnitrophota bacterium]|jgi:glucokinase
MKTKYIIGIDLGGTNLKIALFDALCRLQSKKIIRTGQFLNKDALISGIVESVEQLIRQNHLVKSQVIGLGLGLPGPIDADKGIVHFFPNIPGWKEVHLSAILKKRLGIRVVIDNDANLMALAEYRTGAAVGCKNVVCLTLGTGVGGGLIFEGKLYRGSTYAAGEIGHMPVNENGPRCNCGGIACLEAYIGNKRIAAEVKRLFKKDISLEKVSSLARSGNRIAIQVWKNVGKRLGLVLASIVNLLNPDCIVIGGGVAGAGKVLFDPIRKVVRERAMSVQAKNVKIVKASLGYDSGVIGAALFVREQRMARGK